MNKNMLDFSVAIKEKLHKKLFSSIQRKPHLTTNIIFIAGSSPHC